MSIYDPLNKNQFQSKSSDKYRVYRTKYLNLKNEGKCESPEDVENAYAIFIRKWLPQINSDLVIYHHEFFYPSSISISAIGSPAVITLPQLFQFADSGYAFPDIDNMANVSIYLNICAFYCNPVLQFTMDPGILPDDIDLSIQATSDWFNNIGYQALGQWRLSVPICQTSLTFHNINDDFSAIMNTAQGMRSFVQTNNIVLINPIDGELGFNYTLKLRDPDQIFADNLTVLNLAITCPNMATDPLINNVVIVHYTLSFIGNTKISKPSQ